MKATLALVNRNLKVFLRNRTAVFFSFLSILIIIALYALFLADTQVQNIQTAIKPLEVPEKDLGWYVNSWIMAGLISVNTVTITLGTYGTIVDDIEYKNNIDFLSSPIKRSQVVLGYIISSWILTTALTLIGFIVIEIYIVAQGGTLLPYLSIIKSIGLIILSVISFSAILFYIATFIKSSTAFGTVSTVVGTLIGFLTGVYIPIGVFKSTFIHSFVSLFPVTYVASMLRTIFLEEPTAKVFTGASDAVIKDYNEFWGITLYFNGKELSWAYMISALFVIGFVFYTLGVIRVTRNKMTK